MHESIEFKNECGESYFNKETFYDYADRINQNFGFELVIAEDITKSNRIAVPIYNSSKNSLNTKSYLKYIKNNRKVEEINIKCTKNFDTISKFNLCDILCECNKCLNIKSTDEYISEINKLFVKKSDVDTYIKQFNKVDRELIKCSNKTKKYYKDREEYIMASTNQDTSHASHDIFQEYITCHIIENSINNAGLEKPHLSRCKIKENKWN